MSCTMMVLLHAWLPLVDLAGAACAREARPARRGQSSKQAEGGRRLSSALRTLVGITRRH